ncbi:MAG TPA: GNAT family N-acetyltransferase [Anaerolineales bacterium]|nr:GNAT family N-acetyltransferase [Anaerolineales bacterium]
MKNIRFETIHLPRNAAICVKFRRDSYAVSFPDGEERFEKQTGANGEKYLTWLQTLIEKFPEGCVHVILDGEIVGQMEMQVRSEASGYINLFYLAPEVRGTGLGNAIHQYAVEVLEKKGVRRAQLSVSPTNVRAISYYRKHGWVSLGPRDDQKDVLLMERDIP